MIRDTYLFDRKLKMILFEALENIEISVKTQLSNIMSIAHGSHWYTDSSHFISEAERKTIIRDTIVGTDIPKLFNHSDFLSTIEKELEAPEEFFLKHYKKTYEPLHPPSWMMMEMITFGTLSLMFENLKPSSEKTQIFEAFTLTKKHMISWLHCFSFIRNKCAHHSRLVYSRITIAPSLPLKRSRQFLAEADLVQNDSLYAVLSCVQFLFGICNNSSTFKENIVKLTKEFPSVDYTKLGFTANWHSESLWS